MASSTLPQIPINTVLLVIHDFIARSIDELTLNKGDRIELIERDDDFGDGWYLGKHILNGKTGLFPEVYTTPAPKLGAIPSAVRQPLNAQPVFPDRYSNDTPSQDTTTTAVTNHSPRTNSPNTFDSSVMNETLSVINEHITDMHTPDRHDSAQARTPRNPDSYDPEHRVSYINGHETDEEESRLLTVAEVSGWSPVRVAEYLEDAGVDKSHCDVFQDQEISGEVLLTMEQSAIFIKEFDLGSLGRRLKTWSKIKALQDEIKAATTAPSLARSGSDYSAGLVDDSPYQTAATQTRSASATTPTSHYLSPQDQIYSPKHRFGPQDRSGSAPLASMPALSRPADQSRNPNEHISRPSAASIRQMNHARRHSSMDSNGPFPELQSSHSNSRHSRKISLDRLWSMGSGEQTSSTRRLSKAVLGHSYSHSGGSINLPSETLEETNNFPGHTPTTEDSSPGYESNNDNTKRTRRRFMPKRLAASVPHSRNPSDSTAQDGVMNPPDTAKVDSPLEAGPNASVSGYNRAKALRSASHPKIVPVQNKDSNVGSPPIVTKLEYGPNSPAIVSSEASSAGHSPSVPSHALSFFSRPRALGLRVTSDTLAASDKTQIGMSPIHSPARTGSTTPSTDTKSFELQKSDNRGSTGSSLGASTPVVPDAPPPPPKSRPRARSKKFTSAYTKGLEHKSPVQQLVNCDYSGWMKKRSANIMGTWKPRLFVLRGRRLSYYYSENDTEEKGLIDISGHRVLPAENEKITGLHAQITGAKSPLAPEQSPKITTAAATDLAAFPPAAEWNEGLFIFKLVPPREGMSKAVNFTKPAVHYFAVSSRQEGRLWMAALMKATIDHDQNGAVSTTYNQETISLAKAKAKAELASGLEDNYTGRKDTKARDETIERIESIGPNGLGIDGIGAASSDESVEPSRAGVEGSSTDQHESGFKSIDESLRAVISAMS